MKPPRKPVIKRWLALALATGIGFGTGAGGMALKDSFNPATQPNKAAGAAIPAFVQAPLQQTLPALDERMAMIAPMPDGILDAIANDDVFALHRSLNTGKWKLHDNDEAILRFAAAAKSWNIVVNAVDLGADIHARNDAALREAAKSGDSGIVSLLVSHGANIHVLDEYPLRISSAYGHEEVVLYLLEHGAKPDVSMVNMAAFSATADPAMQQKSDAVIQRLKSAIEKQGM